MPEAMGPSRRTVLLVEDSPIDVALVTHHLTEEVEVDVLHADSIRRAIDALENTAPFCILLDLKLPDAIGFDGLHRLRTKAPDAPILVLTGYDDDEAGLRAIEHGAQDYLVKGTVEGRSLARAIEYAAARKREERALVERANFLRAVIDAVPSATLVLGPDAAVRTANPVWHELAEHASSCAPTHTATLRNSGAAVAAGAIEQVLSGAEPHVRVDHALDTDDGTRWFETTVRALPDEAGALVSHVDVTERKQVEHVLAHQASHDRLTGLANRAMLEGLLDQALARARRWGSEVALLFCDLDRFKEVNDDLGHASGDLVLVETGHRLRDAVRTSDTVARLGGDEFVVLCEDVAGVEGAHRIAERVLDAFAESFDIGEVACEVGISVGIALARPAREAIDQRELLERSDAAMYHAKSCGRGQAAFWDAGVDRIEPPWADAG